MILKSVHGNFALLLDSEMFFSKN